MLSKILTIYPNKYTIENMETIEALKNLGLSEKEARIYLACLQSPNGTAYSIAKISGIKRPTAYVILEELLNKGIAKKIPRAETAQYLVISPEELFSIYQNKLRDAERFLPELKAFSGRDKEKPKVSYYEGLDATKEMYKKMFKENEQESENECLAIYGHSKNASAELREYWNSLNQKYSKEKIKRRILIADDESNQSFFEQFSKDPGVEMKRIPKEKYNSNISIQIFKNYSFISSHRDLQSVAIENSDIANSFQKLFEMLWKK